METSDVIAGYPADVAWFADDRYGRVARLRRLPRIARPAIIAIALLPCPAPPAVAEQPPLSSSPDQLGDRVRERIRRRAASEVRRAHVAATVHLAGRLLDALARR